jgi:hypothetical protein
MSESATVYPRPLWIGGALFVAGMLVSSLRGSAPSERRA